MKTTCYLILTAGFFSCALWAEAGVLELKNGTTVTGKYVGGTASTVRFETSAGVPVNESAQAIALEEKQTKLKRTYFKKSEKVVPGKKAAQFFQIETQINAALDVRLAAALPLIK